MHRRKLILAFMALCFGTGLCGAGPKKKLLLVGQGPDGHPPQTHEYQAGVKVLAKCLEPVKDLEVMVVRADNPWKEGPELIRRSDGVVFFVSQGAQWLQDDPARFKALQQVAARKGGLSVLHWGMGTRAAKPIGPFLQLFGGCHGGPDRKYKVVEAEVKVMEPKHPIVAGMGDFRIKDEFYYRLKFVKPEGSIKSVWQVNIEGKPETVAWRWDRPDGGRSFGFSGLHFHANWGRPEYRRLVAQGVLWTMKMPVPEKGLPVEVKEIDLKVPVKK